jgi:hypothetical protein
MPYVTLGNLGQHHGGHHGGGHGGGHHGGGGPIYGSTFYDPYWTAPSPYLVIVNGEDEEDEKDKKKKKVKLGTAYNWP